MRRPSRAGRALARSPVGLAVRWPDGTAARFGPGDPVVEVRLVTDRGAAALESLSELRIADAYLAGDLDLDGDVVAAMGLRDLLSDVQPLIRAWTFVEPALLGRTRVNPRWVATHYDNGNVQLHALDREWGVYTPGIYAGEDDTLEAGAERKLADAYDALGLREGSTLLDVGCGWGGFVRFCARRGVRATGISLSTHQLAHARRRCDEEDLDVELRYADFFAYRPGRRFDAISLMGVVEDLAVYRRVLPRLEAWLEAEGRVYLDFASVDRPFGVSTFITRHVWPGAFRMVYLPSFTRALARSSLDVARMADDRRNYHLWTRKAHDRWVARRDAAVAEAGERTWRLIRLMFAGTSHVMGPDSQRATAYRMLLARRGVAERIGAPTPAAAPTSADGRPGGSPAARTRALPHAWPPAC